MTTERQARALRGFYRAMTEATPGGVVVERDGVQAAIVDVAPDLSIPNGVVYADGAALRAQLGDLAGLYAAAGVRAWTVWVRPGDDETAAALRAAGHKLDGEPALMTGELAAMALGARRDLDLVPDPGWATIAALNDAAWGVHGFGLALDGVDPGFGRRYVACHDGRPAACVVTWTDDAHVTVVLVATDPPARGRGLCGELMRTALREARDAGARTTSLEASGAGLPIYAPLGYEAHGRLALYERRRGAK